MSQDLLFCMGMHNLINTIYFLSLLCVLGKIMKTNLQYMCELFMALYSGPMK